MEKSTKKATKKKAKKLDSMFQKFMKKSLGFKIAAIAVAVFILAAAFWGSCELLGSPVAKIRAVNAAKNYIKVNMPGMEYDRSFCKYDREADMYYIDITPSGRKQSLRLELTAEGRVAKDGYTLDYMLSDIYER